MYIDFCDLDLRVAFHAAGRPQRGPVRGRAPGHGTHTRVSTAGAILRRAVRAAPPRTRTRRTHARGEKSLSSPRLLSNPRLFVDIL